jgi:hypothetical protein
LLKKKHHFEVTEKRFNSDLKSSLYFPIVKTVGMSDSVQISFKDPSMQTNSWLRLIETRFR